MTIKAVFCFISKKGYLIIKEIIIIPGISFRNLDAPEANTHQTFKRSHYWKEASEQYVLSLTAYHSSLRPPEMASDREYTVCICIHKVLSLLLLDHPLIL